MRRLIAVRALALAGVALFSEAALAQEFPVRPIRLIIPYAAGGPTDIVFRLLGENMKAELGQTIIFDNRPGASGGIGEAATRDAPPDGYTIGATGSGSTALPFFAKAYAGWDFVRDFSSISYSFYAPLIVLARPSLPASGWPELIAYAKANPGKLNFGVPGVGYQLDVAVISKVTGASMQSVLYKGSAPLVTALVSGEVDLATATPGTAKPLLDAGKARALGTISDTPWAAQPGLSKITDIPGLAGAAPAWTGVHGPKGMPGPIVARLTAAIRNALNRTETRQRLEREFSYTIDGGGADVLDKRKIADGVIYRAAVDASGFKPE